MSVCVCSVCVCVCVCVCLHVSVYRRYCKLCIVSAFMHTRQHVTNDHALLCVCVCVCVCVYVCVSVTYVVLYVAWVASDIVPADATCFGICWLLLLPCARSAFLALSYNGALVDTGLQSGLSHHCRFTSSSRESQVSQCTIDGKRALLKDKDITKDPSNHRNEGERFHGCL